MGARVRAITAGFFDGSRVRAGKEFTLPDGMKPGKWLEVLEAEAPATAPKQAPKVTGKGKPADDLA